MREIRTSSLMSGEWKRGMARLVRHRQTKGPAPDRPSLNNRVTPRLYFWFSKRGGFGENGGFAVTGFVSGFSKRGGFGENGASR